MQGALESFCGWGGPGSFVAGLGWPGVGDFCGSGQGGGGLPLPGWPGLDGLVTADVPPCLGAVAAVPRYALPSKTE